MAREVVRALVGLALRLRSGEALARLCALWGDAGLHRGVRLLLVREMGPLAGEEAAQQVCGCRLPLLASVCMCIGSWLAMLCLHFATKAQLHPVPGATQVLLGAAGSEDREVALAACCSEALAPAPAAFRAQLLGALLAQADKGVRVRLLWC